jgi:hypothetical protein
MQTEVPVEFINDHWYLLEWHKDSFQTNISRIFQTGWNRTRTWPENHPNNPYKVLETAPLFRNFLLGNMAMNTQETKATPKAIPARNTKKNNNEPHQGNGSLKGKAPKVFDRDRSKSKAFISDLRIYFQINQHKPNVTNCYSRVLLALSFIKGPNIVNWVDQQIDQLDKDLMSYQGDEDNKDLYFNFQQRFKKTFISTILQEDTYVCMQNLKMKKDALDEYIAEHRMLISELGWDKDSEMSCHSFWQGLSEPLAWKVIEIEGLLESLYWWIKYTQTYYLWWAMSRALRYIGKTKAKEKPKWQPWYKKPKEKDPNAMDVDFTQMNPEEKEKLLKSRSCFKCW